MIALSHHAVNNIKVGLPLVQPQFEVRTLVAEIEVAGAPLDVIYTVRSTARNRGENPAGRTGKGRTPGVCIRTMVAIVCKDRVVQWPRVAGYRKAMRRIEIRVCRPEQNIAV